MRTCEFCSKDYGTGGCAYHLVRITQVKRDRYGVPIPSLRPSPIVYDRRPYGTELWDSRPTHSPTCPDCQVPMGMFHHPTCKIERCPNPFCGAPMAECPCDAEMVQGSTESVHPPNLLSLLTTIGGSEGTYQFVSRENPSGVIWCHGPQGPVFAVSFQYIFAEAKLRLEVLHASHLSASMTEHTFEVPIKGLSPGPAPYPPADASKARRLIVKNGPVVEKGGAPA